MLYTSNYERKWQDPRAIAVSVKPPEYYVGNRIRKLAPTWKLVLSLDEGLISPHDYRTLYYELLDERQFDPQDFVNAFDDGHDYFMLSYGRPGDTSHRRYLADYIQLHTGVVVPEWLDEREQQLADQKNLVDNLLTW